MANQPIVTNGSLLVGHPPMHKIVAYVRPRLFAALRAQLTPNIFQLPDPGAEYGIPPSSNYLAENFCRSFDAYEGCKTVGSYKIAVRLAASQYTIVQTISGWNGGHDAGYTPWGPGVAISGPGAAELAARGITTYAQLGAAIGAILTNLIAEVPQSCIDMLNAAQASAPRRVAWWGSAAELAAQHQDGIDLSGMEFEKPYILLNQNPTSLYKYENIDAWFKLRCSDPKTSLAITNVEKVVFFSPCGLEKAEAAPAHVYLVPGDRPLPEEPFTHIRYALETEYYQCNGSLQSVYDKEAFKTYIKAVHQCKDFSSGSPIVSLRKVMFRAKSTP